MILKLNNFSVLLKCSCGCGRKGVACLNIGTGKDPRSSWLANSVILTLLINQRKKIDLQYSLPKAAQMYWEVLVLSFFFFRIYHINFVWKGVFIYNLINDMTFNLCKQHMEIMSEILVVPGPARTLVKCEPKIIVLISKPKHMLWVLKRTVSLRRFF